MQPLAPLVSLLSPLFSRPLLLPFAFLVLQAVLLALPAPVSVPAAYILMGTAPLLAAAACVWRARAEAAATRAGWWALAVSLSIWAAGAWGNLWQEWVLERNDAMYRGAMLAFNLAAVPIAFMLATDWRGDGRRLVRSIDAALALALGSAYFLFTWAMLTARGTPDADSIQTMVWLLDIQNLFLSVGAALRWIAATEAGERRLFRALLIYALAYMALMFVNNHFIASNPDFGPRENSVITLAFAVLAALALRTAPPSRPLAEPSSARRAVLIRGVRAGSPILLAGALLIVSLFLIRVDYAFGAAGILIAVVGQGLRSTVSQVRSLERSDVLRRERTEYQTIAWTDAVTGVPNRHFLDQALETARRGERRARQPLAVLMIDIDDFKRFNDRFGHPAGDACLREVAHVLLNTLVRPGDVFARYGGEEFVALLREADLSGARIVAERLRAAVEALRIENPDSAAGVVTISVGVASATLDQDTTAASLVGAADKALYEAKCAGRNRVSGPP